MSDDADKADLQQAQHLDSAIANRVKFTEWDGEPRECSDCENEIPEGRLMAINATTCVECAK